MSAAGVKHLVFPEGNRRDWEELTEASSSRVALFTRVDPASLAALHLCTPAACGQQGAAGAWRRGQRAWPQLSAAHLRWFRGVFDVSLIIFRSGSLDI